MSEKLAHSPKARPNCKICPFFEQSGDTNDSYDVGCEKENWNLEVTPGLITGIFPAKGSQQEMARICPFFTRRADSRLPRALSRRTSKEYFRWLQEREVILS